MKRSYESEPEEPEVYWAMDMSGRITPVGNLAHPENRILMAAIVTGGMFLFLCGVLYFIVSDPVGRIIVVLLIILGFIYELSERFKKWLNRPNYVLYRSFIVDKWLEPRLMFARVPRKVVYHPIFFEALCRHLISIDDLDKAYQTKSLRRFYAYVKPEVEKARREDGFREKIQLSISSLSNFLFKALVVFLVISLIVLSVVLVILLLYIYLNNRQIDPLFS